MTEHKLQLTSSTQRLVFALLLGLAVVGALFVISDVWQLIVLAAILAFLLQPLFQWLIRISRMKAAVTAGIIFLILLVTILLPILVGVVTIGQQAAQLALLFSAASDTALGQTFDTIERLASDYLGLNLQDIIEALERLVTENLESILTTIAASVARLTGSVFNLSVRFILFSFFFVMFLINWAKLQGFLHKISPFAPDITTLYLRKTGLITRDVMLGTVGVALIQTLILGLVFALLDLPFVALMLLFTFVFALIPMLGIALVTVPLGIVLILTGNWISALIIWGVQLILINNIDLILRPVITSKELEISGWLIITAFIGGLLAFGVIGLFLGPIIFVLLSVSLQVFAANYGRPAALEHSSAEPTNN